MMEGMALASTPPEGTPTPEAISRWAADHGYRAESVVWLSEIGGITARLRKDEDHPTLYAKWVPYGPWTRDDAIDEAERISWLSGRFPAPKMADFADLDEGSLLVTVALRGESAVADRWKRDPVLAVRAIAEGLGRLHSMDPSESLFDAPEWVGDQDDVERPVIIHGDACAPNTVLDEEGRFAGIVDVGCLGVGDRWADLAIATWSLEWNFGPGHDEEFYAAYGEAPDPERIRRYRELWDKPRY
jgi:kanamycin kinase